MIKLPPLKISYMPQPHLSYSHTHAPTQEVYLWWLHFLSPLCTALQKLCIPAAQAGEQWVSYKVPKLECTVTIRYQRWMYRNLSAVSLTTCWSLFWPIRWSEWICFQPRAFIAAVCNKTIISSQWLSKLYGVPIAYVEVMNFSNSFWGRTVQYDWSIK